MPDGGAPDSDADVPLIALLIVVIMIVVMVGYEPRRRS